MSILAHFMVHPLRQYLSLMTITLYFSISYYSDKFSVQFIKSPDDINGEEHIDGNPNPSYKNEVENLPNKP